jgi:hypothetical protein
MKQLVTFYEYQEAQSALATIQGPLDLANRGEVVMDLRERIDRQARADDLSAAIAEYEQRTGATFRGDNRESRNRKGVDTIDW